MRQAWRDCWQETPWSKTRWISQEHIWMINSGVNRYNRWKEFSRNVNCSIVKRMKGLCGRHTVRHSRHLILQRSAGFLCGDVLRWASRMVTPWLGFIFVFISHDSGCTPSRRSVRRSIVVVGKSVLICEWIKCWCVDEDVFTNAASCVHCCSHHCAVKWGVGIILDQLQAHYFNCSERHRM